MQNNYFFHNYASFYHHITCEKKKNSLIKSTCGRVREFPAFKNYLHVRKKNSLIKSTCGRVRKFPAFKNYLHVRKETLDLGSSVSLRIEQIDYKKVERKINMCS